MLKFKPWDTKQGNAWDNLEPCDENFISAWDAFLQTDYARIHVPKWAEKLQALHDANECRFNTDETNNLPLEREEWMILSDIHQTFDQIVHNSCSDTGKLTVQSIPNNNLVKCPRGLKGEKETKSKDPPLLKCLILMLILSVKCKRKHMIL